MNVLKLNTVALAAISVAAIVLAGGCAKKQARYETNLIRNGSFEDGGNGGVPTGWKLEPFRGAEGDSEVKYGIDDATAADGKRSFYFSADPGTRRFYMLTQETEVPEDATHIRLKGSMQLQDVELRMDQHSQCNFLLTFYDKDHNRFQEMRVADKRTRLRTGSQLWSEEDWSFRLPKGTRYVDVGCILGMNGEVWFDNISLIVPKPIPWETATTKNYVFHWLPGHPMPQGSQESQQAIFDAVTKKLDVTTDVTINYFFYPDTTTIRSMLGLKGYQYVSWDDYEFHSINPNDNHEVIHFITDPVGRPPRSIAEGTAFWILDDWKGQTIDEAVGKLVKANALPSLRQLIDYNAMALLNVDQSMPAAASFVGFLVDRFGAKKLMDLYTAANGMNAYEGFAVAFERVYGIPAADVESAWHERLKTKFRNK
jgi:hypothetical protein